MLRAVLCEEGVEVRLVHVARVPLSARVACRETQSLQLRNHVRRQLLARVVRKHDEADARPIKGPRLVLLLAVELEPAAVAVDLALVAHIGKGFRGACQLVAARVVISLQAPRRSLRCIDLFNTSVATFKHYLRGGPELPAAVAAEAEDV